jgi:hypothetical protein
MLLGLQPTMMMASAGKPITIEETYGIGGIDQYTKLMLSFDGSSCVYDLSVPPKDNLGWNASTWTGTGYFWGGGGAYFAAANYCYLPAHNDWWMNTDYTIDFIIYPNSVAAGSAGMIFAQSNGGGQDNSNYNECWIDGATKKLIWQVVQGGTLYVNITSATAIAVPGWSHVALVRKGNNWRIYINGVMQAETNSSGGPAAAFTGAFILGVQPGGLYPLDAYMDNFRISKGIARWTKNFGFNLFGPYTYPDIGGADQNTVLLVHCDGNEGGTVVADWSAGNNGNGTIIGAAKTSRNVAGGFATRRFGSTGLYLDGASGVSWPASANFNMGSGDFTVECWFCITGGSTHRTMIGQMDAAATIPSHSFSLRVDPSNRLYGTLGQGSTNTVITGATAIAAANTWHHAAMVRSGTSLWLFLDGVLDAGLTISGAVNSSSNQMVLGQIGEYTGGQRWVGYLDEIRISRVARFTANFTPPIAPYGCTGNDGFTKLLLHFEGTAFDVSPRGYGQVGTAGAGIVYANAFWRGAVNFNGVVNQAYISFPNGGVYGGAWDFGANDFTIDWWMYVTSLADNRGVFWHCTDNSNWVRCHVATNGAMQFAVMTGGVAQIAVTTAAGAVPVNEWHHWAVVRSGNVWTIYKDGASIATTTQAYTIPAFSGPFVLGVVDNANNGPMAGWMDEFRVSAPYARWKANFARPLVPYNASGCSGAQAQ